MKKLFKHFWLVFFTMLLTAVADLVGLPKADIGLGFVLAFFYFLAWIIYNSQKKET